jgi:hypothetical protein
MKNNTKITLVLCALLFVAQSAFGATTSTNVPNLIINSFKTAGTKCVHSVSGLLATTSADCGSGVGGGGSVSTSSPITINQFPYWTGVTGQLSGTSTLGFTVTQLLSSLAFNASGTITQNGVPVLTTSSINFGTIQSSTFNVGFALSMSSSGTLSFVNQGYITTSSITIGGVQSSTFPVGFGLIVTATGTLRLTTTSISQFNNDSNYITTSSITIGGVQSSTFPVGFGLIVTATGTLRISTTSISQFNNDSGFITTSTPVAGSEITVVNNVVSFSNTGNHPAIGSTTAWTAPNTFTNGLATNVLNVSSTSGFGGLMTLANATGTSATSTIGASLLIGSNVTSTNGQFTGGLSVGTSTLNNGGAFMTVNASGSPSLIVASTSGNAFKLAVTSGTGGATVFAVASSGVIYMTGTSTALTIGGLSLAAGACTSTIVTFGLVLSTSTDNVSVTPQIYPGAGIPWNGYISRTGATSSDVTAQVCAEVTATPTASKYNVQVTRNIGT